MPRKGSACAVRVCDATHRRARLAGQGEHVTRLRAYQQPAMPRHDHATISTSERLERVLWAIWTGHGQSGLLCDDTAIMREAFCGLSRDPCRPEQASMENMVGRGQCAPLWLWEVARALFSPWRSALPRAMARARDARLLINGQSRVEPSGWRSWADHQNLRLPP